MKGKPLQEQTRKNFVTYGIAIIAFVIMMVLMSAGALSSQLTGLLVPICTYIILAVSLNLTVGVLGELSLGHAGFMCVGAFASAFFSVCMKDTITSVWIRFPLALLIGAAAAALFGFLIGIPVLRLRGDYLAIVTLAFGEIIKNIVNVLYVGRDENGLHFSFLDSSGLEMTENGKMLINGPMGITGTPKDSSFVVGFILVMATLVIVLNIIGSRTGRAVMSIRDNRIAAESTGINITKYKLLAFTISAALAGVAGVLYSHNLATLTATTQNFGYNMSIMILVFVVLGGMGNIRGSMIAAVVLYMLPEMLRGLNSSALPGYLQWINNRMLIYAIILIVMMIFTSSPKLAGFREKISPRNWFRAKSKKEAEE